MGSVGNLFLLPINKITMSLKEAKLPSLKDKFAKLDKKPKTELLKVEEKVEVKKKKHEK